jgi:tetratricopeptide (TPR) repeat protein
MRPIKKPACDFPDRYVSRKGCEMSEINKDKMATIPLKHDSSTDFKPWSPNVIALITVFLSMLPGGILHGLNYARLGYPQKKKMALASNVIIGVFLFYLSLYTELPRLLPLVINFAYAGYFYKSQDHLYHNYLKQGGKKGSVLGPVSFSVLTTALLVGLSFGYDYIKAAEYNKALSLMKEGNYPEAEQLFKSYKKYAPKDESTYYNLALIYQKSGKHDLAIAELKYLLRLNPRDNEALSLMDELKVKTRATANNKQ